MVEMYMDPGAEAEKPAIHVVRIWKDHEPDGAGGYREVEWVEWAKKGTNGATTQEKIKRLASIKEGRRNPVWEVVEPLYEHWLRGQEEPLDGVPLAVWPAVTPGQVDQLRAINIRTVEDVRGMTDADLERFGSGARALRDKAGAFLDAREDAGIAEKMVAIQEENAQLRETIGELTESVKALQGALGTPERTAPQDVANGGLEGEVKGILKRGKTEIVGGG